MRDSWEEASSWYDKIVGDEGHYYHTHVILPAIKNILRDAPSILDVGCGQGVLARHIPKGSTYLGIDASPSLIKAAKEKSPPNCEFQVVDACKPWSLKKKDFSAAVMILCLQNMADPDKALLYTAEHLAPGGELVIVLNHPFFRIPRQTSWGIDEPAKMQYRRVNSYMSPLKIPLQTHPGHKTGETWSFHHSLTDLSSMLNSAGFGIMHIEEWCSNKTSQGPHKQREDRARKEFPLFMSLICQKLS